MNTLRDLVIKAYEFIVRRELTYNEGEFFYLTWYGVKKRLLDKWRVTKDSIEERGYRCRVSKDNPYGDLRDGSVRTILNGLDHKVPRYSVWKLLVSFIPMKNVYLDCFHKYGERKYYVHPSKPIITSFKCCVKCGLGKGHKTFTISKKEPRR